VKGPDRNTCRIRAQPFGCTRGKGYAGGAGLRHAAPAFAVAWRLVKVCDHGQV
jgi:hypothetical protein